MKVLLIISLFSFSFYSCNHTSSDKKQQYETILNEYIHENPIIILGEPLENNGDTTSKRMFAHPSYHAFFNKNDEETILTLKLVAHYTDLNINISNNNIDSLVFENQKAGISIKGTQLLFLIQKM